MAFAYQFPPVKVENGTTLEEQAQKIIEEAQEVLGAVIVSNKNPSPSRYNAVFMEVFDVIQACETFLRIADMPSFAANARHNVIDKNIERGYYG